MSITNKLVANIKQTQVDIGKFLNTNNVICIDTCNNRIGINTKTPRYSIDICGIDGKIFVNNLDTSFINFKTISGTTINCLDGSFTRNLDTSFINFKTISGSSIRATTISGTTINCLDGSFTRNLDTSFINFKTISGSSIRATTISANTINAIIINTTDLNTINYNTERGIFTESIRTIRGDFSNISVIRNTRTNISGGTIDCSNLNADFIVSKNIQCLQTLSAGTVSTNNLVSVSGIPFFTLSNGLFYLNTRLGDDNKADIKTLIGQELGANITTTTLIASKGYISDCCINNLKVTNIDISGRLTLPQQTSGLPYSVSYGSLAIKRFENSSINSLTLYNSNSKWSNIFTSTHYATLDLCGNSNNNIVNYIITTNSVNLPTYRYVPIKFKTINSSPAKTELFNINSNNNYIEISNNNFNSGIYEINASITLSYNNTISGDVEPNDFTFGLYDKAILDNIDTLTNINSSLSTIIFETSYNYVKNRNLILAFDNSYNYSSVSLNYIGPLYNYIRPNNPINYKRGLCYLVNSQKDIYNFNVEYFSSTIKLLNYDT
jgi:hypothetical protein